MYVLESLFAALLEKRHCSAFFGKPKKMQTSSLARTPEVCSQIFSYLEYQQLLELELVCKAFHKTIVQFNYLAFFLNTFEASTNLLANSCKTGNIHNELYCSVAQIPWSEPDQTPPKKYHRLALINSSVNIFAIPLPRSVKNACRILYEMKQVFKRKTCQVLYKMPQLPHTLIGMSAHHCMLACLDKESTVHLADLSTAKWIAQVTIPNALRIVLLSAFGDYKKLAKSMKNRKYQCYRLYVMLANELRLYQVIDEQTGKQFACTIELIQVWQHQNIYQVTYCHGYTFATSDSDQVFVLNETMDVCCISQHAPSKYTHFPSNTVKTHKIIDIRVIDVTRQHILHDSTDNTYLSMIIKNYQYQQTNAHVMQLQLELDKHGKLVSVMDLKSVPIINCIEWYPIVGVSPSGYYHHGYCYMMSYGTARYTLPITKDEIDGTELENSYANHVAFFEQYMLSIFQSQSSLQWYSFETKTTCQVAVAASKECNLVVITSVGIPVAAIGNVIHVGL